MPFKPILVSKAELAAISRYPAQHVFLELRKLLKSRGLFYSLRDPNAPEPPKTTREMSLCFRTERTSAGMLFTNYWGASDDWKGH